MPLGQILVRCVKMGRAWTEKYQKSSSYGLTDGHFTVSKLESLRSKLISNKLLKWLSVNLSSQNY